MKDIMPSCDYDYIVVGAGAAGIQMAYFLQKAGRKYVVYEAKGKAASFFQTQPRNRQLLSINKKNNYFEEETFNMRHDWNSLISDDKDLKFPKYTDDLYPNASVLHQYLNDFAKKCQLNIQFNTKVTKVSKPGSIFKVSTKRHVEVMEQTCTARCVLLATGALEENLPTDSIPGIDLADTYGQFDTNKEKYKNKMVLIVGGGNSAFETANWLADTAGILHVSCKKKVNFAWNTHYVGDLRAVNNTVIEMQHLKSLHSTLGNNVDKIEKTEDGKFLVTIRDVFTNLKDVKPGYASYRMAYDHVISCLGWRYVKPEMFDSTIKMGTVKDGRLPRLTNTWETDTENLFCIGTIMAAIDKKSASGFIHGFRYNTRTLFNLLENRFFNTPLPHTTFKVKDLDSVAKHIIERSTISDALYQMNNFLCDVLVVDEQEGTTYYTEIPIKHVMERPEFRDAKHCFIMYLAYGFDKFDQNVPNVDHVHGTAFLNNSCVGFLHPHLEYHNYGKYVDQTEMMESLIVRYDEWTCHNFPQWRSETNENLLKFHINDKVKWTTEKFKLNPHPPGLVEKKMTPLTEEEMSRIPKTYGDFKCRPTVDLKPKEMSMTPMRQIVLRPTPEEMRASMS